MAIDDVRTEFLSLLDELVQKKKRITEVNNRMRTTVNMEARFVREYEQELESIALRVPALLDLLNALVDKLADFFIGRRTRACVPVK